VAKIEIGRFSELLRRMLAMKGAEVVAGDLSPEISPTIELEGPTAEWSFLKAVRLQATNVVIAGAAATLSMCRLRNPLASGVIAVVDRISYSINGGGQNFRIVIGRDQVDLAIGGPTEVRDSRWQNDAILSRSALSFSSTNLGVLFGGNTVISEHRISSTTIYTYDTPIVLNPGDSLEAGSTSVNSGLQVSWAWQERMVPPLEL